MSKWDLLCPLCGHSKTRRAKKCRECYAGRVRRRKTMGVPTTVSLKDGSKVNARSKVEASWAKVFGNAGCLESYHEDIKLQYVENGYIRNYTPDFRLETVVGTVYCEIKSNKESCLSDTRPPACIEYDKDLRFICLGGRPRSKNGFTVRLLSNLGENIYTKITLKQLSGLLECNLT